MKYLFDYTTSVSREVKSLLLTDEQIANRVRYYWMISKNGEEFHNLIQVDNQTKDVEFDKVALIILFGHDDLDIHAYGCDKKTIYKIIFTAIIVCLGFIGIKNMLPLFLPPFDFFDINYYFKTMTISMFIISSGVTVTYWLNKYILCCLNNYYINNYYKQHLEVTKQNCEIINNVLERKKKMDDINLFKNLQKELLITLSSYIKYNSYTIVTIQTKMNSLSEDAKKLPEDLKQCFNEMLKIAKENF